MTDSPTLLSERILARRVPVDEDSDESDDCGAFGALRGNRERSLMLEFRLLGGQSEAFPYSMLERVQFDPSEGITLHFLGAKVLLEGRNFRTPANTGISLLDALLRQRVSWIRETEELRGKLEQGQVVVVTKITLLCEG